MPIYGYRCGACGAEIEKRQGFHDAPLTTCEKCGGALRRILHPVGIVFKGTGFYNTDNRKTAAGASSGSGSEPTKGSGESYSGEGSSSSESSTKSSESESGSKSAPAESAPAKSSGSESSSSSKPASS